MPLQIAPPLRPVPTAALLALGLALSACEEASPADLTAPTWIGDAAPGADVTGRTDSVQDATAPEPDVDGPDAAEPEPDAAEPEPDVAEPEPDVAEPEPDVAEPEPDVAEPEPDAAEPEPDAAEPDGGPTPPTDPAQPGGVPFTTSTVSVSAGPLGAIDVLLHRPEGPGPFPLTIFGPGFQLGADNFPWVGEHLASHGIVTLTPSFGDSLFAPFDHADLALGVSALLDWVELQPWADTVDPAQILASGHSRGAKATLLAATQDARFDATMTLDPVDSVGGPFGGSPTPDNPSVAPELMGSIGIPVGVVGTGLGPTGLVACAPADEGYTQYYDAAPSPAWQWEIPSAGHNDFAVDLPITLSFACPAGSDPAGVRQLSKQLLVAFVRAVLGGDPAYAPWLTGGLLPGEVSLTSK